MEKEPIFIGFFLRMLRTYSLKRHVSIKGLQRPHIVVFNVNMPHSVSSILPNMLRQWVIMKFVFHKIHTQSPTMWTSRVHLIRDTVSPFIDHH